MRETVKAAGGLVINKKGQILFIHRKGVWDLPKGKLDSGERLDNTAIRETSEETGIPLKKLKLVQKEILNTDFGICIRCKKEIPPARLVLVPESKKCVHCA